MERCVRIHSTWYYHQRRVVMPVVVLSIIIIAMRRDICTIVLVLSCLAADFISHSMSREQLKFIFCDLLPDLSGKTVLDIGSRMGPVLYAVRAYGLHEDPQFSCLRRSESRMRKLRLYYGDFVQANSNMADKTAS